MGCNDSRQENIRRINPWEPKKIDLENNSYDGWRTVKDRVFFPGKHQGNSWRLEWSCDQAVNEDWKIEQCWDNQTLELSVSGDLKAEGSLSEAIDLLHFSEISERETSSISICLKDINEDGWDMSIGSKPDTNNKLQRNARNVDIAETNGQHNGNPLAYCTMMNRALSYNYPNGRVLIGQKMEDAPQRRRTNHHQKKNEISEYTYGPYKSFQNHWHAENSSGSRLEYQRLNDTINSACKSMETRILKYGKISKEPERCVTSLHDTGLQYGSSTETGSCDQIGTEGLCKTSRPTEENSEYPENKSSASLSIDSSVYFLRKTLNTQIHGRAALSSNTSVLVPLCN